MDDEEKKQEKITIKECAPYVMLIVSGISVLMGNVDGAIYTVLLLIAANQMRNSEQ